MHLTNHYQFHLQIFDQDSRIYHKSKIENFRNCLEDLKFSAIRFGMLENNGVEPYVLLEPIWSKNSKYFCDGFRLILTTDGQRFAKIYNKQVYRYQFIRAVQKILQTKQFTGDITLQAKLTARYKNELDSKVPSKRGKIKVSIVKKSLPLVQHSMKEIAGIKRIADKPQQNELPVFFNSAVVEEMLEMVLCNKKNEQAGILLGQLCQDPSKKNLFLICNKQVALIADKKNSSIAHFRFTPENFYTVQRSIPKKDHQIPLGWYHSHPWLFESEPENGKTSIFFSVDDFAVMEAAFSAPYQIAIVIGKSSDQKNDATVQMYGWLNGGLVQRGFYTYEKCQSFLNEE